LTRPVDLSANVRSMSLPDLSQFEPSRPKAEDKPSRLQPRIELEDREIAGRHHMLRVGPSRRVAKNAVDKPYLSGPHGHLIGESLFAPG
jgi:hypothetical protein